jgi:hypothetical protein
MLVSNSQQKNLPIVCCSSAEHLREIRATWRNPNPSQSPTNAEEALLSEKNPSLSFRYDPLLPLKTDLSPSQRT